MTDASPQVYVSTKHKRIVFPRIDAVAPLSPNVVDIDWQGVPHMAVTHDSDHVRLLRNFGINVPAPVACYYDWAGGQPFKAQIATAEMLTTERRAYVLNGMGTGKTRTVIWSYDWLRRQGEAKRMLVVAPLSTLTMTWVREAFIVAPHLKVNVLYGNRERRLRMLADPADIYVVNHDGVRIILKEVIARPDIDIVVLDELAVYRNGSSMRFRTMKTLLQYKNRAWGLTGSPTPNGPTDAWAQVRLITPHNAPAAYTNFRMQVMVKVSNFKWVPKPSAIATVHSMMQPAVRYTLDDIVELPEVVKQTIDVPLGPKQQALYDLLRKKLRAMSDAGEITVANAGVLMSKLLQVAMGWVYTNEHKTVPLDNDARLLALQDVIESTDRKVLVFVAFKHALSGVAEFLRSAGHPCEEVDGDVLKSERDRIFGAFQNSEDTRIIVAHPKCMAHGLTLTEADTITWFGPYASLDETEQANARITRIGQKHKQQIIMLSGTPVEKALYKRLEEKRGIQNMLLELLESKTEGI